MKKIIMLSCAWLATLTTTWTMACPNVEAIRAVLSKGYSAPGTLLKSQDNSSVLFAFTELKLHRAKLHKGHDFIRLIRQEKNRCVYGYSLWDPKLGNNGMQTEGEIFLTQKIELQTKENL